jgi:hypothetical protein
MPGESEDKSAPSGALLSVEDIALRWGTGSDVVARLVGDGTIPSLDMGLLAREGRTDVPVVRAEWAESVRVDSPGAVRRVDDPWGEHLHPAASTALDFHQAMSEGDADAVYALSSRASRSLGGTPEQLLETWLDCLGDGFSRRTGITTGVYLLTPHQGVGVRLTDTVPAAPERFELPTPVNLVGVIPLIEEDGVWRVDLVTARLDEDLGVLITTAPPDES